MTHRRNWISVMAAAVLCCGVMALVDGVIQPGYAVKSLIKIAVFALVPLVLTRIGKLTPMKEIFRFRKKGFATALGLGLGIYVLILGGWALLKNWVDFSGIAGNLTKNAGVTRDNFLWVSLYISFVNSLLEEFFFRGFLFTNLKQNRRFAYLFSALLFAVYHVAMMIGWFDLWLLGLVLAGLFVGGLIFDWLNEKQDCIYVSWLTHMFANFAINTIGFILLR
ncbi:MAG: CPBP family intramembrane metalloprotease [Oscillospiraceae bacterium]|nr:CPBP family intramembrane metalloprotease [Oscillospiraceae bacterium]